MKRWQLLPLFASLITFSALYVSYASESQLASVESSGRSELLDGDQARKRLLDGWPIEDQYRISRAAPVHSSGMIVFANSFPAEWSGTEAYFLCDLRIRSGKQTYTFPAHIDRLTAQIRIFDHDWQDYEPWRELNLVKFRSSLHQIESD